MLQLKRANSLGNDVESGSCKLNHTSAIVNKKVYSLNKVKSLNGYAFGCGIDCQLGSGSNRGCNYSAIIKLSIE